MITSYVALYTHYREAITKAGRYKRLMTTMPTFLESDNYDAALEEAKEKETRDLFLNEVLEVDLFEKEKIMNYYS